MDQRKLDSSFSSISSIFYLLIFCPLIQPKEEVVKLADLVNHINYLMVTVWMPQHSDTTIDFLGVNTNYLNVQRSTQLACDAFRATLPTIFILLFSHDNLQSLQDSAVLPHCDVPNLYFESKFLLIHPYTSSSSESMRKIFGRGIGMSKMGISAKIFIAIPTDESCSITSTCVFRVFSAQYLKGTLLLDEVWGEVKWSDLSQLLSYGLNIHESFQGINLGVMPSCTPTYIYECKITNSSGTLALESGLVVYLLRDLQMLLNFTETVWNVDDLLFFTDQDPAFKLLKSGKIDLVITQNVYRPTLAIHTTLLQPTYLFRLKAFFRQPPRKPGSIFVKPFRPQGWAAVCGFWLAIGCVAFAFHLFLGGKNNHFSRKKSHRLRNALNDWFIWMVGTCCKIGFSATLNHRIMLVAATATAILTNSVYQAGFVAVLSSHFEPIRTMGDLVDARFDFIINNNSASIGDYVEALFNFDGEVVDYTRKIEDDAIETVIGHRAAYLEYMDTFSGTVDLYAESHPGSNIYRFYCEWISTISVDNVKMKSGMVLPEHSPLRETLKSKITRIIEIGLQYRYEKTYKTETRPLCLPPQLLWSSKLGLFELSLAFQIVIIGGAIALAVLMTEYIHDLRQQRVLLHF